MIKHIGKHGIRKVVICYMTVPGEDHMCLLVYSDRLPQLLHDEVMKVLESPAGQQEANLADALFRHIMPDGENALQSLHKKGLLQKVQTEQIVMTPDAHNTIKLNELNKILKEIEAGQDANKKLAEAVKDPAVSAAVAVNTSASPDSVLGDADLANQLKQQATKMRADASGLLAEAERLENEAATLSEKAPPNVINNSTEAPQVQS